MLALPADLTVQLIGATFFACGIGTLVQSLGAGPIGARMPFVMVPGGAPTMLFAGIAAQSGLPTAAGSALLASAFYWVLLPVFTRCLRLFPRIVVGAMLLLVSVNLIRIYAAIVVGQPGSADFAQPRALGLALATIVATVVVAGTFRGTLGRLAVLIGLMAGATLGWALDAMPALADVWRGPLFTHPVWLPFGMPRFDVLAALPLLIFTAISMAEATAQTVAVGETCGKAISLSRDVPKTIRGDALASLAGALFGTPLIVTSAENIGVVQTTGVRSRYVTAAAGAILIVIALFAPLARLAYAIPAAVVGGTALVVFAMIGVMGIRLLASVDLHARASQYTLAAASSSALRRSGAEPVSPFRLTGADRARQRHGGRHARGHCNATGVRCAGATERTGGNGSGNCAFARRLTATAGSATRAQARLTTPVVRPTIAAPSRRGHSIQPACASPRRRPGFRFSSPDLRAAVPRTQTAGPPDTLTQVSLRTPADRRAVALSPAHSFRSPL